MQMCPYCGKVYDESEYARCPYCRGKGKYTKKITMTKTKNGKIYKMAMSLPVCVKVF